MNKMSAFQIITLAVFAAFAVASVLIFAFVLSSSGDNSAGPVTIWGPFDESVMGEAIQQYAEKDANFEQVTYVRKDEDTYMQEIIGALAKGTGPDLFLLRQDHAYAAASIIQPEPYESLARTKFEGAFIDGARPFLGASGVLGIPFMADPLVLYWNRDLLAAAGSARPPVFWDELYDLAREMTERTETGTITRSAIAFGEYGNIAHAKMILGMLIMQAGGAITAYDRDGRLMVALSPASGESRQAASSALRFYTEFADPSKDWYTWNRSMPASRDAFAAGDVGLYFGLASEEALIRQMNPNLNFSATSTPQVRNMNALGAGYVYALAVPRTSANPAGARQIAFLLGGREAADLFAPLLRLVSARRDALAELGGENELVKRQAILMRSWVDPDPVATEVIFRDMIQNTTSGATLLSDAIHRAEQQLQSLLNTNI